MESGFSGRKVFLVYDVLWIIMNHQQIGHVTEDIGVISITVPGYLLLEPHM